MSKLFALLALISFSGTVLTELAFGFTALFTHRVRAYPIECEGQVLFGTFCDGDLTVPLNPSTFRAFPDRQEVIEWRGGEKLVFKQCTVRDFGNWQCTIPADRGQMIQKTMQDGHLTVIMYDSNMSPKTNVNAWDLVYVALGDWLRRDLEYEMNW
jgi:hypothetical protein